MKTSFLPKTNEIILRISALSYGEIQIRQKIGTVSMFSKANSQMTRQLRYGYNF